MTTSPHTEPWIGTDPETEHFCQACECHFDDGYRIGLTDLKYCGQCVTFSKHLEHFRDNHGEGLTGQEIIEITNDLIEI